MTKYNDQPTTRTGLPHIYLQTLRPDSSFYDLTVGDESVSGYFESEGATGQEVCVDIKDFLAAALSLNFIMQYDEHLRWVYVDDNYEGREVDAIAWVENVVEFDGPATQAILRRVFEADYQAYKAALKETIARYEAMIEKAERMQEDIANTLNATHENQG